MEFPHLGENCSEKSCNKLDFLPMKCDECKNIYCHDHFNYERHRCEGSRKRDIQVPACPLCGVPVPGRRGEPPDVVVSAHIDNDCQTDIAKERRNKIFTNRCLFKGCKGKEMVPLICSECSLNFCFKHRHGADHKCEGKLGAKRRIAAQAAEARVKSTPGLSPSNSNSNSALNLFAQVQGQMSEDEALARALSLSMQESQPRSNPSSTQRVGGESDIFKCILS